MAISQSYFQVTDEQLDALERHINKHGHAFYTCKSATDPDSTYTLRWTPAYKLIQCNCAAGREGRACWHQRAAMQAESIYQDSIESEARAAALREKKAVARDGARAYERKPFSLLAS